MAPPFSPHMVHGGGGVPGGAATTPAHVRATVQQRSLCTKENGAMPLPPYTPGTRSSAEEVAERVANMRNRVKNLSSTPARAAAPTVPTPYAGGGAAAAHVTFAPGAGGTPMPGGAPSGTLHTPAPAPRATHLTQHQQTQQQHQTPLPAGAAGARRRVSVDGLLTEYLRSQGNTPPHVRNEREVRVAALRENTNSAQLWCEFLEAEEVALGDDTHTGSAPHTSRNGISLFRLFEHAIRALPQVSRSAPYDTQGCYLRLYLGLARQQMVSNMDDARDTFKYLKSEGFWSEHAMFWTEWAAFGHQYKGEEKALKILTKGIAAKARWKMTKDFGHLQQECIMEGMRTSIQEGNFSGATVPSTRRQSDLGGLPLDGGANGGLSLDGGRQLSATQPISGGGGGGGDFSPDSRGVRGGVGLLAPGVLYLPPGMSRNLSLHLQIRTLPTTSSDIADVAEGEGGKGQEREKDRPQVIVTRIASASAAAVVTTANTLPSATAVAAAAAASVRRAATITVASVRAPAPPLPVPPSAIDPWSPGGAAESALGGGGLVRSDGSCTLELRI